MDSDSPRDAGRSYDRESHLKIVVIAFIGLVAVTALVMIADTKARASWKPIPELSARP
jgi:hypothetical protein